MSYVVWIVTKPYATAHFEMLKIIYLKVLYRSKSVVKLGSILKSRYIRFRVISDRVISDRVISGLQCIIISSAQRNSCWNHRHWSLTCAVQTPQNHELWVSTKFFALAAFSKSSDAASLSVSSLRFAESCSRDAVSSSMAFCSDSFSAVTLDSCSFNTMHRIQVLINRTSLGSSGSNQSWQLIIDMATGNWTEGHVTSTTRTVHLKCIWFCLQNDHSVFIFNLQQAIVFSWRTELEWGACSSYGSLFGDIAKLIKLMIFSRKPGSCYGHKMSALLLKCICIWQHLLQTSLSGSF